MAVAPSRQVTVAGWTFTVYLHPARPPRPRGEGYVRPIPKAEPCAIPAGLRWWLDPRNEAAVKAALRADPDARRLGLADLLEWVLATGMRLEDSLALTWLEVEPCGQTSWCVATPGRAVLPLGEVAAAVLERRRGLHALYVFRIEPRVLAAVWRRVCRSVPGADLGALRRGSARRRADDGIPAAAIVEAFARQGISEAAGYRHLVAASGTVAG